MAGRQEQFTTISIRPVLSTSAYAAGDIVGTAGPAAQLIKLAGVSRPGSTNVVLKSLKGFERSKTSQQPPLTVYLLKEEPGGGTYTDNGAFAWGNDDMNRVVATYVLSGGSWKVIGTNATYNASAIEDVVETSSEGDLWLLIVADGAYTAAAVDSLELAFGFDRGLVA